MDLKNIAGFLGEISRARFETYKNSTTETPVSNFVGGGLFEQALAKKNSDFIHLISEVKRASPTGHNASLDAVETARAFERGGASAVSVLTEPTHFKGELQDLEMVSKAVRLPTLRKDFIVHPHMLTEAKKMGASAALLIVAALQKNTKEFLQLTHAHGLDALVEIHTEGELEIALEAGARIIGINNRDLHSLEINLGTAPRIGQLARQDDFEGPLIALSGYSNRAELVSLSGLFDAVLIGSSLAKSGNIETATRALLGG